MMRRFVRAQDVRYLVVCPHCRDGGDRRRMIADPVGTSAGIYHPACVLSLVGFEGVLRLPPADRGLFSIADLGVERARELLASMDAPPLREDFAHAL